MISELAKKTRSSLKGENEKESTDIHMYTNTNANASEELHRKEKGIGTVSLNN